MSIADFKRVQDFFSQRGGGGEKTERVAQALALFLDRNPQTREVYLCGSYASGEWVDEESPLWLRDFKIKTKGRLSDIDFFTIPKAPSAEEYEILPHERRKMIKIYPNELSST
jgi:predicted nucleotidyltransferase